MLNHEQRYVLEDVAIVQTIAASQDVLCLTRKVIGETHARTEVLVVVVGEYSKGAPDCQQLKIRPALGNGACADQIEILVPAHPQVQGESLGDPPIVLEVESQLLGAAGQIEVGIACAGRHANHSPRCRKTLRIQASRIGRDNAGVGFKINLQRGVGFEESAEPWIIDVVDPHAEGRSEEHTSELQSHVNLVCRLLLEKK